MTDIETAVADRWPCSRSWIRS